VGGVVLAVLAGLVRRAWVIAHREEEQPISEAQARENARAVVERDPALGSRAKRGPDEKTARCHPVATQVTSCVGAVTTRPATLRAAGDIRAEADDASPRRASSLIDATTIRRPVSSPRHLKSRRLTLADAI
jgi:hypothetical protein